MRNIGVFFVAIGVSVAIMGLFLILFAEDVIALVVGLGCQGFLAIPLVFLGIRLTRRAARADPEGEDVIAAAFLRTGTPIPGFPRRGPLPQEKAESPRSSSRKPGELDSKFQGKIDAIRTKLTALDRLRAFDLNSLTPAGWLLVLVSCGLLIVTILLSRWMLLQNHTAHPESYVVLVLPGGCGLGIGFFFVGQMFLTAIGVPTSKPIHVPLDHLDQSGRDTEEVNAKSDSACSSIARGEERRAFSSETR